jgi:hypothetical protein
MNYLFESFKSNKSKASTSKGAASNVSASNVSASKGAASNVSSSEKSKSTPKKQEPVKEVFSLDNSYFDQNTYYSIFCHKDKFERLNNITFDTNSQKIIKKEKKSNYRTCEDTCQNNKECTSYTFNDNIDECTTFKSYPKNIFKNQKNVISGIKNSASFDFSKLNQNQKNKIRNYCIQNYYEKKKIKTNIEKCIQDVYKKRNDSYIDLDIDCISDKIRPYKTKEDIKKSKIDIPLKNESPTLQRYFDNFNSYQTSKKKYNQMENQVKIYDPQFISFQKLQNDNIQELHKKMNESISTIQNTEKQLEQQNKNVIGETFQNQEKHSSLFISILFILLLFTLIFHYYKK